MDGQWLAHLRNGGAVGDGRAIAADHRLMQGVQEFNREEFYASHETWEALWNDASYPDRLFCIALTKLGAGFAHAQRRQPRGVGRLLGDGLRFLTPFAPAYAGVDTTRLGDHIRGWLLAQGEPSGHPAFPRIERAAVAGLAANDGRGSKQ